ncbi:MAG: virulence RhuM family protein [Paludibacteraceae bacterium]|nr:virulence RhuM family protein [Paludibacteraceae bacterium]
MFSLDAIFSVRYRVNSKNATQFRIRANKELKEISVKLVEDLINIIN